MITVLSRRQLLGMSADATHGSARPDARAFGEMLSELADLGPPSEIRARGPELAARVLDFDRVLLTSVAAGELSAEALSIPAASAAPRLLGVLRTGAVSLAYPLVEGEVVRRRRAQVVRVSPSDPPGRSAFAATLEWGDYAVAPILVDGQVVGLLHADRSPSGRPLADDEATTLATFAACFGLVYERAALRHRLRVQREEMRRVARWADGRSGDLGESAITLAADVAAAASPVAQAPSPLVDQTLRELLTQREIDVLRFIVSGETNAGIARALVVSEGTVKFHVKNILRKLGASNRAEATSRYLRMTLDDPGAHR